MSFIHTIIELLMIPYLHLFFDDKSTYFLQHIVLILIIINLSVRNNFY